MIDLAASETRHGGAGATTEFVTSKDGTRIAFDRMGEGPPIILVAGATGNRSFPYPLGSLLAPQFTVFNYDRRGRNESGDTQPHAIEREIEDIAVVTDQAGGAANVFGMSSGAVLALEAAAAGLPITKLALYEAPLIVDDSRPPAPGDYLERLNDAVSAGRRGDAVEIFMKEAVRVPPEGLAEMRSSPMWPALEALAHTLAYDGAIMEGLMYGKPIPADRARRWRSFSVPTLILDGGASEQFMHTGAQAVADIVPNAQRRTLEGQTHDVNPEVLAPVLIEFFRS
jgi:pimeloyl-ACP methyl ester carboxylesterase